MILLLPEAKHVVEKQGRTKPFRAMRFAEDAAGREALELAELLLPPPQPVRAVAAAVSQLTR